MSKRFLLGLGVLAALSFIGTLIVWPMLPAIIPSHWNAAGMVDGFSRKWLVLFFGALPLLVLAGLAAVPKIDPRGKNYRTSPRAYGAIAAGITLALMALGWVFVLGALGTRLPYGSMVAILVGVLLLVVGNYMPQLRSNFFAGFRTPWALENDLVWRKTQRAGGRMLCAVGLLVIIAGFAGSAMGILILVPLALLLPGLAGVYLYSYLQYRKTIKTDRTNREEPHADH